MKLETANSAILSEYEIIEQPIESSALDQLWREVTAWFPTESISLTKTQFFHVSNLELSSIQRVHAFLYLQNTVSQPYKYRFNLSITALDSKHQCTFTIQIDDTFSVTLLRSEEAEKLDSIVRPFIENGDIRKLMYDFGNDFDRMSYTLVNGNINHTFHAGDDLSLDEKFNVFNEFYNNDKQHKALCYLGMQGFEGDVYSRLGKDLSSEICLKSTIRQFHFNLDSSGLVIFKYQHDKELDEDKYESLKNEEQVTAKYRKVQCHAVFIISDDSFYCVDASIKKTPRAIPNQQRNRLHSKCIFL